MLQISSRKFFKTSDVYETLRRATYYTNYRMFLGHDRIETPAGSFYPTTGMYGLATLTCEIMERIEKWPGGPYPGEVIATSGDTLINDFAAIISFALNVTCTSDPDLTRRLVASEKPTLGADAVPQKYIPRMFDREVRWQRDDADILGRFVADLLALERKSYEGAMRAIRRYVAGAHRISDDVNLAYALFVMSIESLAQEFDSFVPEWSDYDANKRRALDKALLKAPEDIVANVHAAVLDNEHVAMARRFRSFTLDYVSPAYFREEAELAVGAISRPDLSIALRQAYSIRSGYVHSLQDIPRVLIGIDGYHEMINVEDRPALTFAGLARLARHVIKEFIARGPKVETEDFDWRASLPDRLTMQLASEHWISNPDGFNTDTARLYFDAFLGQIAAHILNRETAKLSDMRPVLQKIERLVPGLSKPVQRMPLLTIYFLFNFWMPESHRSKEWETFFNKYKGDFDTSSVISVAAHLASGQNPDWSLETMEDVHRRYFDDRHQKTVTKLGRFFEAAFTLRIAEQNRKAGNMMRALELIAFAVECFPKYARLLSFESSYDADAMSEIDWMTILMPPEKRET
jgi:hypothetical protein